MQVPYDSFDGMTQQQFQDTTSPYQNHGKLVPITVPKGWRRVELTHPGKHVYVHMGTSAITRFPKEIYDTKKEAWATAEGTPIPVEDLSLPPQTRALLLAYKGEPPKKAAAVAASALPALPAPKVEKEPEKVVEKVPEKVEEVAPVEPEKVEEAKEEVPFVPSEPPLPVLLMFPGQGSQYMKMLSGVKDIPAVKDMVAKASAIL